MRWLANYLQQVFCCHDFVLEEKTYQIRDYISIGKIDVVERGILVSQTCNNCGYHRTYKKFGKG
jgi:hypothetical protein